MRMRTNSSARSHCRPPAAAPCSAKGALVIAFIFLAPDVIISMQHIALFLPSTKLLSGQSLARARDVTEFLYVRSLDKTSRVGFFLLL
jgi:hypothetical protein